MPGHVPGVFRSLSSYVSPSSSPSRSLPFFLADWDVNPHPSTSRHVTFLPTASTHLPNYRSSRKKREGNLSVRTMRILRSASVYGLRNVLSSFILMRLFSRTVNENNRVSRRSAAIAEGPAKACLQFWRCLNLSCHLAASWWLSGRERLTKFARKTFAGLWQIQSRSKIWFARPI